MYRLCIIFQPILRFFVKHSLFSKWMPSSGRFHDGVRETCFVFQLISWSPRRNAGRMGPEFCRGKNVKHTSGRVYLKGVLTRHHSWTSVHKKKTTCRNHFGTVPPTAQQSFSTLWEPIFASHPKLKQILWVFHGFLGSWGPRYFIRSFRNFGRQTLGPDIVKSFRILCHTWSCNSPTINLGLHHFAANTP